MKRIYVTLEQRVDRPTDSPEDVGEVVVLDWDAKRVLRRIIADSQKKVEVGRSRGASGITWYNGFIYVSCRQALVKFDADSLEELGVIEVGEPTGLHQIKAHDEFLYVVCTGGDALKRLKDDRVIETIRVEVSPGTSHVGNLHFNSIGWDVNGDQYHLYMQQTGGTLVNYTADTDVRSGLGNLAHDICFLDDRSVLVSASGSGQVLLVDIYRRTRREIFRKGVIGGYAGRNFVRGLAFDPNSRAIFVSVSPGLLYELDADNFRERAVLDFSNHPRSAPFDILLDPRDW